MGNLELKVDKQGQDIKALDTKMGALEVKVDKQGQDIKALDTKLGALDVKVNVLNVEVSRLHEQGQGTKLELGRTRTEVAGLTRAVGRLEGIVWREHSINARVEMDDEDNLPEGDEMSA